MQVDLVIIVGPFQLNYGILFHAVVWLSLCSSSGASPPFEASTPCVQRLALTAWRSCEACQTPPPPLADGDQGDTTSEHQAAGSCPLRQARCRQPGTWQHMATWGTRPRPGAAPQGTPCPGSPPPPRGRVLPSGTKPPSALRGVSTSLPSSRSPRSPPRAARSGLRAVFGAAATRFKRANRRARREGGPRRSPRLGL